MLILLPPSETKNFGSKSAKLDLKSLSYPELGANRKQVIEALTNLSKQPKASKVLGISNKQQTEIENNLIIKSAKTSAAIEIYSGVLFNSFGYQTLNKSAQRRANESLVITSALFGLLGLQDLIPHYRLSGDVVLPRFGSVAKSWQSPINDALIKNNPKLIVDMRSGVYAKFWQPNKEMIERTVVVKIMSRTGKGKQAKKLAISHNNKFTKGLLIRDLVSISIQPKSAKELLASLKKLNWECELTSLENKPALLEVFK